MIEFATVKLRALHRKLDVVRRALEDLLVDNATLHEQLALVEADRNWWRSRAQAFALALRDREQADGVGVLPHGAEVVS